MHLDAFLALLRSVFPIEGRGLRLALASSEPEIVRRDDGARPIVMLDLIELAPDTGEIQMVKQEGLRLPMQLDWPTARIEAWVLGWGAAVRTALERGRPDALQGLSPSHLVPWPGLTADETVDAEVAAQAMLAPERLGWMLPGVSAATSHDEHIAEMIELDEGILRAHLAGTVLAGHARSGWVPTLEAGEGPATGSRFGGRPWLAADERWPSCGHCARPMRFYMQLDLAALPGEWRAEQGGLLQLFCCDRSEPICQVECESWLAGSTAAKLVRVVDTSGPGAVGEVDPEVAERTAGDWSSFVERMRAQGVPVAADVEAEDELFPARRIAAWTERVEYPQCSEPLFERPELQATLADLGELPLKHVRPDGCEALYDELAGRGDKLGGWPYWLQGPERPPCPECGEPCEGMFQLFSNEALPCQWGDTGVAYLARCTAHPDRLALLWQSC